MPTGLICEASKPEPRNQADLILEANHRIANSLAIIAGLIRSELSDLSSCKLPAPTSFRRSLRNLSLRIDALGRLHRLLTDADSKGTVELSAYLREIVDAGTRSLANKANVKIAFNCDRGITFLANRASIIGSFVVEAMINSLKHSRRPDGCTIIYIDCKRTNHDRLVIEVKDNGLKQLTTVGSEGRPHAGTGSRLMRSLAELLRADLEIPNVSTGHTIRLQLPICDNACVRQ